MRALLLALMFGVAASLSAHSHEAKEAMAKAEAAVKQGVNKVQATVADTKAKGEAIIQAVPLELLKTSAPQHLHNKIVHFPLALGFFGAIFFLLSIRWASYLWPSRVLLGAALLGGLAALPTGEAMEDSVQGTSLLEVFEWHERFGQASVALLALILLLTFLPSTRKWSWVVVLAGIFALSVAGALGGAMAHS